MDCTWQEKAENFCHFFSQMELNFKISQTEELIGFVSPNLELSHYNFQDILHLESSQVAY